MGNKEVGYKNIYYLDKKKTSMSSLFPLFRVVFFLLISCSFVFGEGTKEIQPTEQSHGRLQLMPYFSNFAMINAAEEHRLHINICEPAEKIYFGFGQITDFYGTIQTDVQFLIKDPFGNIVYGPFPVPDTGAGFINTYIEAVSGPDVINPLGYESLDYTPLLLGDYYMEFLFTEPYGFERKVFEFFDITVVSSVNEERPGRLWSKNWQLTTDPLAPYPSYFQAGFDGIMFIYSDDGVVTSVDLNDMQPFVFNISANQTGCFNTGNYIQDRKSTDGNHVFPQYRVFLNDPDSLCFPSGQFGSITAPTTITGCIWDFCINITVDKPGKVEILLDLNGIPGYQLGTQDIVFTEDVVAGHNCIHWNGQDGLGNLVASGQIINLEVNYFNGLTHLPLYDVEGHDKGFKVEIIRPFNPDPIPALFWDDTDIPGGTAELVGCTDTSGCHTWPAGNCLLWPTPVYCSLGDMRTINTWWYAHSVRDSVSAYFEYPFANANFNTPIGQNDIIVCKENDTLQLYGQIQFADYGVWSGGSGQFLPNDTALQGTYVFSPAEIADGYATLFLTTVGGFCPPVNDTINVIITEAVLFVSNEDTICLLDTVMLSASGGVSYLWSPIAGLDDNLSAAPMASPSITTTYSVNIINVNGCTASDNVVLNVNNLPPASAGVNDTICIGDSIQLNASGGIAYQWSPPVALTDININNPFASPLNTITYTVLVTDSNGCFATSSIEVFVNPLPLANAGQDENICFGDSITLMADGGIFYEWAPSISLSDTGIFNPMAFPMVNTNYIVTVTDVNGCSATSDMFLTVNPLPPAYAGVDQYICIGDTAILNATGGVSYAWTPVISLDDPWVHNPSAMPILTTIYAVAVTDTNNCTATDSVTVVVNPLPPANAGADFEICIGDTAQLNASGGLFYQWFPQLGLSQTDIADPFVYTTNTETYYVLVTDSNGCFATDSILIVVNDLPIVSAGNDTSICYGSSVQLNASGGIIYLWSPSAGLSDENIANPIASPTSNITYIVGVIDGNSCFNSDSVVVVVNPLPILNLGSNQEICTGDIAVLTAAGLPGSNFQWSTGDVSDTVYVSPLNTTTYTVTVEDAHACGTLSGNIIVTVNPMPYVYAGEDTVICKYESVTLSAIGLLNSSFVWSTNETTESIIVSPLIPTVYFVTATDENFCGTATDSVLVNIFPEPIAAFYTQPDSNLFANELVSFINNSVNAATYFWSFGDGATSTNENPYHVYAFPNSYNVMLIVTSSDGCLDTAFATLHFFEGLEIPNVFTPNGDGYNDVFMVQTTGILEYQLQIFNRWGVPIFESYSTIIHWDGRTLAGEEAASGTYFYVLTAKSGTKDYSRTGTITLLR